MTVILSQIPQVLHTHTMCYKHVAGMGLRRMRVVELRVASWKTKITKGTSNPGQDKIYKL